MIVGARGAECELRPLVWNECGEASMRWWESDPMGPVERRAVVIWIRELGKVAWWIVQGKRTLALGYIESLHEPGEKQIAAAKRAAAQRWWELLA